MKIPLAFPPSQHAALGSYKDLSGLSLTGRSYGSCCRLSEQKMSQVCLNHAFYTCATIRYKHYKPEYWKKQLKNLLLPGKHSTVTGSRVKARRARIILKENMMDSNLVWFRGSLRLPVLQSETSWWFYMVPVWTWFSLICPSQHQCLSSGRLHLLFPHCWQ